MKGIMISLDGGEGSGKTSCIKFIECIFANKDIPFITTREPGGTKMAEEIRELLLKKRDGEKVDDITELLLMTAGRRQHLSNVIQPSLDGGKVVISDRFIASTIAYQSYGRGIDLNQVKTIQNIAIGDFKPNYTFILDVDPEVGMERARNRGELDRIEEEKMDFFRRVREGFLAQANEQPERFIVIDASASQEKVLEQVKKHIDIIISKHYDRNLRMQRGSNELSI